MENIGSSNNNVYFIFLGSILTFLSTSLIEYWKIHRDRNEKRHNFLLIVKLGLVSIQKTLEKLKSGLDYRTYFEISTLDILDRNLKNLEGAQRETYYLPDEEKQERFIDLVSEVATYSGDLRAIENYYSNRERELLELINNKSKNNKALNVKKTKVKEPVDSNTPQKQYENLVEFINKKRQEKVIDLVDLKRRLDDFIKSIEN